MLGKMFIWKVTINVNLLNSYALSFICLKTANLGAFEGFAFVVYLSVTQRSNNSEIGNIAFRRCFSKLSAC